MRLILAAGCLCLVLGCSSGETDAQRQARAKAHVKEELDTGLRLLHRQKEAAKAERVKAEAVAHDAEVAAALVEAREWEGRFTAGEPKATSHYRKLVETYPGTPEAKAAEARIGELERLEKTTIETPSSGG